MYYYITKKFDQDYYNLFILKLQPEFVNKQKFIMRKIEDRVQSLEIGILNFQKVTI